MSDVECNGICLTGSDIGIPSNAIAAAHPDCPKHGHLATHTVDGEPIVEPDPATAAVEHALSYAWYGGLANYNASEKAAARVAVDAARPIIEADLRRKLAAMLIAAAPDGPVVLDTDEARHIQTRRGAFYDAARLVVQEDQTPQIADRGPCGCPGHHYPGVRHVVACCDTPHIDQKIGGTS